MEGASKIRRRYFAFGGLDFLMLEHGWIDYGFVRK